MRRTILIFIAMTVCAVAAAQLDPDCPGFRNPTSFNTGNPHFYWTARVGDRTYTSGNYNDTTTGYHIMSTCATAPDILGHSNITSTAHDSGPDPYINTCGHNFFDANDKRFQIIGPANAGIDQFTIAPGTNSGMPRIPPGYTHSIRLGDMRNQGQSINLGYGGTGNNKGAEALFYTMDVNPMNALLIINYAVVARRYSHSAYDAGEFLIRIVKQNDDETWPNAPINDSLWYKVSAPTFNGSEMPAGWAVGAGDVNNWPCTYAYKPWAKVAISLSQFMFHKVRIEMYTSDCIYNADPIYAYISGDYQAMKIYSSGCADAQSAAIDTLYAPEGLLSYTWYAAVMGYESEILNAAHMDSVVFRQVSGTSSSNIYIPTLNDFIIAAGPNVGDTIPTQTFMCKMTSALDPHKPITSKVYANVQNRKPTPYIHYTTDCDLNVQLNDWSVTFGNNTINRDSTRWVIYSDTLNTSVLDTLWGENVSYQFPSEGYYNVSLRVMIDDGVCGSERTVAVRAMAPHPIPILLADSILCEGERASAYCSRDCHLAKTWQIGDSVLVSTPQNPLDTVSWTPDLGTTLVQLTTTVDGLCPSTTTALVKTLGNTTITSSVDASILCLGDSVVLSAEGLEQPRWLSVPYDSSLASATGQSTVTVSPRTTTTYTVLPTQDTRCMQNESNITILVLPYPIPTIWTSRPFVDLVNPLLSIEDRSPYSNSSLWTFSDGLSDEGERIEHYFGTSGDSVSISLHTCNEQRCCSDTTVSLPVQVSALWIPNTFTPDDIQNNRFTFYTTIDITYFEIWIYNRWGGLVYHGTDINQGWDGRAIDGTPCPFGAYAYHYVYSTSQDPTRRHSDNGTVTLLR